MKFKRGQYPRRDLLMEKLGDEIIKRKEEDNSIIVIEDWNQNIMSDRMKNWKERV